MLFIGYQSKIDIQILDVIFHTNFKHLTRSKMMSREQKNMGRMRDGLGNAGHLANRSRGVW